MQNIKTVSAAHEFPIIFKIPVLLILLNSDKFLEEFEKFPPVYFLNFSECFRIPFATQSQWGIIKINKSAQLF